MKIRINKPDYRLHGRVFDGDLCTLDVRMGKSIQPNPLPIPTVEYWTWQPWFVAYVPPAEEDMAA